jgi:hypothetical protein
MATAAAAAAANATPYTHQGKCSLLLIDNIGAYSWQDRASRPPPAAHPPAAAAAPGHAPPAVGAGDGAGGPPLTLQRVHAAGAALLQLLALRLRVAVVATKSANVGWQDGAQGDAARMVQRDYLPASWQRIVTHRLLMQPGRPPVVDGQQEVLTHVAVQLQVRSNRCALHMPERLPYTDARPQRSTV